MPACTDERGVEADRQARAGNLVVAGGKVNDPTSAGRLGLIQGSLDGCPVVLYPVSPGPEPCGLDIVNVVGIGHGLKATFSRTTAGLPACSEPSQQRQNAEHHDRAAPFPVHGSLRKVYVHGPNYY